MRSVRGLGMTPSEAAQKIIDKILSTNDGWKKEREVNGKE